MKYLQAILLITIIIFTSCDGKDRARQTNEEKLKQSNLSDSFFVQEKYFPEEYSEVITDTIINNNIINIKSFTDMNNNVLNEIKIDTILYKYFYREIKSNLIIKREGETIFSETIDKSYFNDDEDNLFWKEALMLGLYIDEAKTTDKQIYFNVSYCMIESETCKDYNLIIDNKGEMVIEKLITEQIH